jgi:hypothetical protein
VVEVEVDDAAVAVDCDRADVVSLIISVEILSGTGEIIPRIFVPLAATALVGSSIRTSTPSASGRRSDGAPDPPGAGIGFAKIAQLRHRQGPISLELMTQLKRGA